MEAARTKLDMSFGKGRAPPKVVGSEVKGRRSQVELKVDAAFHDAATLTDIRHTIRHAYDGNELPRSSAEIVVIVLDECRVIIYSDFAGLFL